VPSSAKSAECASEWSIVEGLDRATGDGARCTSRVLMFWFVVGCSD